LHYCSVGKHAGLVEPCSIAFCASKSDLGREGPEPDFNLLHTLGTVAVLLSEGATKSSVLAENELAESAGMQFGDVLGSDVAFLSTREELALGDQSGGADQEVTASCIFHFPPATDHHVIAEVD